MRNFVIIIVVPVAAAGAEAEVSRVANLGQNHPRIPFNNLPSLD
jgi:hypothetical protein